MFNHLNQLNSAGTIREKLAQGYNLFWNSNTEVVHRTAQRCHSSDHLDTIVPAHEHFFVGRYDDVGRLIIVKWDPLTAMNRDISYSNCKVCRPELYAR